MPAEAVLGALRRTSRATVRPLSIEDKEVERRIGESAAASKAAAVVVSPGPVPVATAPIGAAPGPVPPVTTPGSIASKTTVATGLPEGPKDKSL